MAGVWTFWKFSFLRLTYPFDACELQQCSCRSNQCILDAVDIAIRRASGKSVANTFDLQTLLADPLFSVQFITVLLLAAGPLMWVISCLIFFCWVGNLWTVPINLELQEEIMAVEVRLQEEIWEKRTEGGWMNRLNRLSICFDVFFCCADFVLDIRMVWVYLQTHHYWFAAMQSCMGLRSMLDQTLRHGLLHTRRELLDSLRMNLRTDKLLLLLQSERTGEATLSFLLQVYALYYMTTDVTAYWTAAFSSLLSICSISWGCYLQFDVAFTFWRGVYLEMWTLVPFFVVL